MARSNNRRNPKSRRPTPDRLRIARTPSGATGGQIEPVNHLHARYPAAPGEYPEWPVDRHSRQDLYLRHVHGTVRGGVVKWVKGVLLTSGEPIPASPPANAVEATLSICHNGDTDYVFTRQKTGRMKKPSGLGPVTPGEVLRLVTWACCESSSGTKAPRGLARRSTRAELKVVLADELPTFRVGAAPVALLGTTVGNSEIMLPTATVAVPLKPPGNCVDCQLQNTIATGPKMTRVAAMVYGTRAEADRAKLQPGPTGGIPTTINPPASTATCLAPGARVGSNNWIVAWAQHDLPNVWTVCQESGRQFTVS